MGANNFITRSLKPSLNGSSLPMSGSSAKPMTQDGFRSGCGGAFRDALSAWVLGFSKNLDAENVLSDK